MAQIFISRSGRDKNLVDFFSNILAGTKVKGIFEEFEKILACKITSAQVASDIENSNAVFVILSQNVQNIPHTRDWVVWEAGVAKNKDIWIFEPLRQFGSISVITPYLKHYIIFEINNPYLGYIRKVVESSDDSHVLPTLLVTTGIGALLGKGEGAVVGALGGLAISDKSKDRPAGIEIRCFSCSSSYNVHIPQGTNTFRCPVCNAFLRIEI
jgi:hypothetical protein